MTLDELRQKYPDLYQDKTDADMVYTLSQATGASPVRVAYDMGLDPSGYARNEGTMDDLGTSLELGYEQTKRGLANLPNLVSGLVAGQNLYETPEMDNEVARIQGTFSPGYHETQREIGNAWDEGRFGDYALGLATNPSYVANQLAQSAPAMVGGGFVGMGVRGAVGLGALGSGMLARGAAIAAPYAGEGTVAAGIQYKDLLDKEVDPRTAALTSLATGVGVGALAGLGGFASGKVGFVDPERFLSGMTRKVGDDTVPLSYKGQIGYGALSETGQEMLQSPWEQAMSNVAQDKPWDEGLARSAIEGGIAGGIMGGGFNVLTPPLRRITPNQPTDLLVDQPDQTQGLDPATGQVPGATGALKVEDKPKPVEGVDLGAQRLLDVARSLPMAVDAKSRKDNEVTANGHNAKGNPSTKAVEWATKLSNMKTLAEVEEATKNSDGKAGYWQWVRPMAIARIQEINAEAQAQQAKQPAMDTVGVAGATQGQNAQPIEGIVAPTQTTSSVAQGGVADMATPTTVPGMDYRTYQDLTLRADAVKQAPLPLPPVAGSQLQNDPNLNVERDARGEYNLVGVLDPREGQWVGKPPAPAPAPLTPPGPLNTAPPGPALPISPTPTEITPDALAGTPTSQTSQETRTAAPVASGEPDVVAAPTVPQTQKKVVINDEDPDAQRAFDLALKQVEANRRIPEQTRQPLVDLLYRYFQLGKYNEYSGARVPSYTTMAAVLSGNGYPVSHPTAGKIVAEFQASYAAAMEQLGKPVTYHNPEAMEWSGVLDDGNFRGKQAMGATAGPEELDTTQAFERNEALDAERVEQSDDGAVASNEDTRAAAEAADRALEQPDSPAISAMGEQEATEEDFVDDAALDDELGYQLSVVGNKADAAVGGIGGAANVSARPRAVKFFTDRHLAAANIYRRSKGEPPITLKEAKDDLRKLSDEVLSRHFDRLTKARISGRRLYDTQDPKTPLIDAYQALQDDITALGEGALRGSKNNRTVVELDEPDTGVAIPGALAAWQQATQNIPNAPTMGALPVDLAGVWEEAYNAAINLPDVHRTPALRNVARSIINEQNTQPERGDTAVAAAQPQGSDAVSVGGRPDNADRVSESGDAQPELAGRGGATQEPDVVIGAKDASGVAITAKRKRRVIPPTEPQVQQGLGEDVAATNPTTEQNLRATIASLLGSGAHWRIHVYKTPEAAHAAGHTPRKVGNAYGWVESDAKGTKHAHFIVSRIETGTELGKFLHEVGAHIGLENILSPELLKNLVSQLRKWAAQNDNSQESKLAKAALERVENAQRESTRAGREGLDQAAQDSELIAYFLEEAVKAGVNPTATHTNTPLGTWFRRLWTAFKRALRKLRLENLDQLTAQHVVDLAYGAARMELNPRWHGTASKFRRFDSMFMSSGAGGQWYSWGHYIAKRMGVGKHYMEMLVRKNTQTPRNRVPPTLLVDGVPWRDFVESLEKEAPDEASKASQVLSNVEHYAYSPYTPQARSLAEVLSNEKEFLAGQKNSWTDEKLAWLNANEARLTLRDDTPKPPEGQLFYVDVDARPDEIMHWDLPFNEQPKHVQDAIKAAMVDGKLPVPGAKKKPGGLKFVGKGLLTTGYTEIIGRVEDLVRKGNALPDALQIVRDDLQDLVDGREEEKAYYGESFGDYAQRLLDLAIEELAWFDKHVGDFVVEDTVEDQTIEITDDLDGQQIMQRLVASLQGDPTRADWIDGSHYSSDEGKAASLYLDSLGIKGMEHWDEPSRSGRAPKNRRTTNLVVFNDKNIHRVARAPGGDTSPSNVRYGVDIPSHITAATKQVGDFVSDKYTGAHRGLLGWMGINQMVERFGDTLPILKNIEKTFNKMSDQAKTWLDRGDQIERLWYMLTPQQLALTNSIAGNATLQQFDPSKDQANTPEKQEIAQKWKQLQALDAANPKVKGTTVILAARKHYQDVHQESLDYLEDVLKQAKAAGASTHAVESVQATVKALKKKQTHFWLPLHRFGDFHSVAMSPAMYALHQRHKQHLDDVHANAANPAPWSKADDKLYRQMRKDPKHYEAKGHESERAARRHAEQWQAKGWKATSNVNRFTTDQARAHLKPEIEAFERMLSHTKLDAKVADKLVDSYTDLLIEALPENHILKRQLDREGIAGWDPDMKRAFAKTAQSQAFAMSRLLHVRKLSEQLGQLERQGDSFEPNSTLARDLHGELLKQQELAVTRSEDPYWVRFATGFNYMSMLGGSPFFWMLQLAQVPTITLPYLIGRNKANVGDTFRKLASAWKQSTKYIKWGVEAHEWRAELDFSRAIPGVSAEELQALKEMDNAGRFVFTIGQDLGAAAEGRNTKTARFIRSINTPTHATELINRVSTGLAAYRISRGNHVDPKKAIEFALRAIDNTQVNMDPVMGARNLKTLFGRQNTQPFAKIVFQFWKFQQGMAYTTLTTMKDAWTHPDPALRKQARDSAIGLTLSLMTTSGIFGLPFVGTGAMLLSALFSLDGDADEDDDVERMVKNWLKESPLPDVVADALNKGFLAAMLPTDVAPHLAPRFGMGTLMNPLGYARFDDAERGEDFVKEVMFSLAGPTGSSAAAFWDGIQAGLDGNYSKAAEKIMPLKLLRDMARTYTLADQGVSTGKGETRIDPNDLSAMSWVWQAMGVTPMKKAMYHEGQAGVQSLKTAVTGERDKLLARHAQSRLKGEDVSPIMRDIMRFNQRNPSVRIKAENLRQAYDRRRDNRRKLTDTGILADKQNQPYLGNAAWTR